MSELAPIGDNTPRPWEAAGRDPWEKLPDETAKAFSAFVIHRDSGPTRTVEKTRIAYGETVGKPAGVHRRHLEDWARRYHWAERCDLWDLELDRRHRARDETLRDRVLNTHQLAAQLAMNALLDRLRGNEEDGIKPLDPSEIDWAEVSRLLPQIVRAQRLALGEPTDFVKGSIALSPAQVQDIVGDVVGICLRHIDEDRTAAVYAELDDYFRKGRT